MKHRLLRRLLALFVIPLLLLQTALPYFSLTSPSPAQAQTCTGNELAQIQNYLTAQVGGVSLDQAAVFLADMTDITGAYYDATKDRIVFVGKQEVNAPKFDKDDLAVAIRAVVFNNTTPSFSLERRGVWPNIEPIQDALYFGGIEDTHFGKVLLDADWMMKIYGNGFYENNNPVTSSVPGYKSILQRYVDYGPNPNIDSVGSRLWISPDFVILKKDDSSSSFVFDQVKMQILSEPLSPSNDPAWNQAVLDFATNQTQYYDQYANEIQAYYDTKLLAKITAVIKWIKDNQISTDFTWAKDYQPKYIYTPRTMPRITSPGISKDGHTYYVNGGVSLYEPNTYNPDDGTAAAVKTASEAVNAPAESPHWTFTKDGQTYHSVAVQADAFRSLGGYSSTITDMGFPTAGDLTLNFTRSYSSFASSSQYDLGRGWSFLPAQLSDTHYGYYVHCESGQIGDHIWKLHFQSPYGLSESFTYYNCTTGYQPDDPSYHSTITGDPTGYKVTLKDQTQYLFSPQFALTAIRDKNGNSINYAYDALGKLITISDSQNHTLTLSYNTQNLISQITDWSGRTVKYGYDAQSNLITVTDPRNNVTTYTYNANNQLASVKNRLSQTVIQNTYTPEAKLATQTLAGGLVNNFSHDLTNRIITITDNNSRTERTYYGTKARILEQTDALNNSSFYTYGQELSPLTIKDKRGNTTSFTYDANGNPNQTTLPTAKTIAYQYNPQNRPTQITDNRYSPSKTTSFTYDTVGNLTTVNDSGLTTSYTYNPMGEIMTLKDPLNQTTTYTRDLFGYPTTIISPLNETTTNTYDGLGRLTKVTDPNGKNLQYAYDANGNLLTEISSAGTTTLVYNAENRLTRSVSPTNQTTDFTYNSNQSLTTAKDALSQTTTYGYDAYQNLISRQNALSRTTSYQFDPLNRPFQETSPGSAINKWEYDQNGNLTKRIDAQNRATSYTYDNLNRLTKTTYPDNTSASFTYDDRNNLLTAVNTNGTTTFTYDVYDRITRVTSPNNQSINYTYTNTGSVKTLVYPDSKTVTYTYDANNRLKEVSDWNTAKTTYTYFANGLVNTITYPNNLLATHTYDANNRLTTLTYTQNSTTLATYTYERNANGLVTKVTESGTAYGTPQPTPTPTLTPPLATPTPTRAPTPTPTGVIPTPTRTPTPTPLPPTPTPTPSGTTGPDLIVTGISTTIANPASNENFDVIVRIKNQGTTTASSSFLKVGIYYDLASAPTTSTSTDDTEYYSDPIAPGQEVTVTETYTDFDSAGNHTIWAYVDQAQKITETSETNNTYGPHTVPVAMVPNSTFLSRLTHTINRLFTIPPVWAQTASQITQYTYDALNRLTQVTYPDTIQSAFTYDALGNRQGATYDTDDRITNQGSITFTHDVSGNRTAKSGSPTQTLTYDFDHRLTSFIASPPPPKEPGYTLSTSSFGGLDIGTYSAPAFTDIDADGDQDMFIGTSTGVIYFYRNTGTNAAPSWALVSNKYMSIDIGSNSAPIFVDIDNDGDRDLYIGESDGVINYFANTGTTQTATFAATGSLIPSLDVGTYSIPNFADIESDNDQDLITGASDGTVKLYKNTGTPTAPIYSLDTFFPAIDIGSRSAPVLIDYDNDSDLDLFIGKSDGTIAIYTNSGTPQAYSFSLTTNTFTSIDIGSNSVPAFANLDGDTDKDLFIGEYSGNINYYLAAPQTTSAVTTTYKYNALDQKIEKASGGVVTRYLNDVSGYLPKVVAEANGSNTLQNYYLYGLGVISQGPSTSSSRQYLLPDGLGNIRLVTNSTGTIIGQMNYDPFGNTRSSTGTLPKLGFQSEPYDTESGFIYLRARYYDPVTARFLTRDPLAGSLTNPQSQNPYAYAGNNPVNYSDPSGMIFGVDDALIGGAILTTVPLIQQYLITYGPVLSTQCQMFLSSNPTAITSIGQYVYQSASDNYVGRTVDFVRRAAEHTKNGRIIEQIPGLSGLSEFEARAVEQVLIEKYGLQNLANKINSISPNNPIYQDAIKVGTDILKRVGL